MLTLKDIEKDSSKSEIYLGSFDYNPAVMFVDAAMFRDVMSRSFVIDEPYTEEFSYAKHEHVNYYTFPPLQLIHNKKRLVKLLWFPYSDQLKEQMIKTQSEFYICYDENQNFICYPLRIHKDTKLDEENHTTIKELDIGSSVPTYIMHIQVWYQIIDSFRGFGIHNLVFYKNKDVLNHVIQFLF